MLYLSMNIKLLWNNDLSSVGVESAKWAVYDSVPNPLIIDNPKISFINI